MNEPKILQGNWYRVFVFPDWRFPLSMSIQDPKKKADFMKYLSNAGFSLTNILQREPDMDEQIKLLLGWIDKYINLWPPFLYHIFFLPA